MAVHSLHVFDRKGKTLFTKRYAKATGSQTHHSTSATSSEDAAATSHHQALTDQHTPPELQAEQRKLVFGMLFSLREVLSSLSPKTALPSTTSSSSSDPVLSSNNNNSKDAGLHSIRTGASTLYTYETHSGLRFVLYLTGEEASAPYAKTIRTALQHLYHDIWMDAVTRSPLYKPDQPNVADTSFEQQLDAYLTVQPWYR